MQCLFVVVSELREFDEFPLEAKRDVDEREMFNNVGCISGF